MRKKPTPNISRDDTDADMVEVMDHSDLTDEELATARPLEEVFPNRRKPSERYGVKQKAPTKQLVSLRLDPAIIDHFKVGGPGWQVRMGAALKASSGLHARPVKASRAK